MNPYDIERIFTEIEEDIIKKLVNQFRKDKAKGGPAGFKDWRIRQLKSVRRFIKQLRKDTLPWYKRLNRWIKDAIEKAFDDALRRSITELVGETEDDSFFQINRTRMEALQEATVNDLEDAEAAVFRKTEDEYRQIIYKAEMALNSGMYTYDQAVDIATKDFLRAGINSVEYKNGARHTVQDYAKMVLRTNTKRAAIMAEGEMRTRLGIHTVYARWRDEACPKCLKFLGRIMVDDVYSVGTPDELVGLPEDSCMLSEAMAGGFLHPNCLDTVATYDPGLYEKFPETDPRKKDAEYRGLYELRVKKDAAEHQADVYQRMADNQLTASNKKMYAARAKEKREEADEFYVKLEEKERKQLVLYRKTEYTIVDYEEEMTLKRVQEVISQLGVDFEGVTIDVITEEFFKGTGMRGSIDVDLTRVTFYPDAYENIEQLVKTIAHEYEHLRQIKALGIKGVGADQEEFEDEVEEKAIKRWEDYMRRFL